LANKNPCRSLIPFLVKKASSFALSTPSAIVAVAQALNLQVIAEGVESAKEDAFLTKNGINERQGFLFAKPMPAVAFERWYKRYLKRA
jgi:EAL domain-containing protein (putative c-di-GMP-specific phosphodiesterase class I)